MKRLLLRFLVIPVLCAGLLIAAAPAYLVAAQTPTPPLPEPTPPPGFRLVDHALGVALYRKDYPNGSPDFVQVLDLRQGARLELLYGNISEPRPAKGSFGGPDPRMTSPALSTYWDQSRAKDADTFCVANGSFFYMPEYPTRLAFPLKVNGEMVTEGWGINTYLDNHMMLELWDDHADIQEMNQESLYASSAPNILGGLTEEANKRAKFAVGRTFIGLVDNDRDGQHETLLLITTQTATQKGVAGVLREFGADKVMMLDGGGSTQLLCQSGWHIKSDRPIPQAVSVIAAKPPPVAVEMVKAAEWPVLVAGEDFPLELEVRNTGTATWTSDTTEFVLRQLPIGIAYTRPVPDDIPTGQTGVISDTLTMFRRPGLYTVRVAWGVQYEGETYYGKPFETHAVVIPSELAGERSRLETELQTWKTLAPDEIGKRLDAWVNERVTTPAPMLDQSQAAEAVAGEAMIHAGDAILVPLLMLPIVILLGFGIARRR